MIEQRLPTSYQQDQFDPESIHVLAINAEGLPIGTGRIKPSGHLGRLAVLMPWRGQKVGKLILEALIEESKRAKHQELHLHANFDNLSFYLKHNFTPDGPVFMDGGVPHQKMIYRRTLQSASLTSNSKINQVQYMQHG